jgi:cell wall-associated NlpC family hydrolase
MIDALLEGLDGLLGHARVRGGSASPQVAGLAPPPLPAGWSSTATQALGNHHDRLSRAGGVFAAGDDETRDRVDAAGAAVRDGKAQMGVIKDDYKRNRDRLAPGSSNPEISARIAELDRQRAADGANTIRSTLGRLPAASGAPAAPASMLSQVMPAVAPLSAVMPAATAPLQMLQGLQGLAAPATSMLTGITLPHTTTHPSTPAAGGTPDAAVVHGPGSAAGRRIAQIALREQGMPYVWGGGNTHGPTGGGFDCSGLVQYAVYQATGIVMPRVTDTQVNVGVSVNPAAATDGDLVYFSNRGRYSHTAIVVNDGTQIIEAPDVGQTVSVRAFNPNAANIAVKRIT